MLFFLSSQPGLEHVLTFEFADKIEHALAFGVLGVLLFHARLPHPLGSVSRGVLVTILVAALGIGDEIHQSFVPNREASVTDVLADSFGGFAAAITLVWWHRRLR